jgi:hypothetical protein
MRTEKSLEFLSRVELKEAVKKTWIELDQAKADLLRAKESLQHAGGLLHNLLAEELDRGWPFVPRKKIKARISKILVLISRP